MGCIREHGRKKYYDHEHVSVECQSKQYEVGNVIFPVTDIRERPWTAHFIDFGASGVSTGAIYILLRHFYIRKQFPHIDLLERWKSVSCELDWTESIMFIRSHLVNSQ